MRLACVALCLSLVACEQSPPASQPADGNRTSLKDIAEKGIQVAETAARHGVETARAVRDRSLELAEAARQYAFERKEEFQRLASAELRRLESGIQALEYQADQWREKAGEAVDEARPAIDERIAALRQRAAEARDQLRAVRDATPETWNEVKRQMAARSEQLADAVRHALDEFRTPSTATAPAEPP